MNTLELSDEELLFLSGFLEEHTKDIKHDDELLVLKTICDRLDDIFKERARTSGGEWEAIKHEMRKADKRKKQN